ncbi:hypothetical protein CAI21_06460 [Alkalilimnicola ehrlichii]|uniref:NAD-dependent epimerase/dehydratase domain-containing protein n=1 Tax=Alkalilimnicola ehrlichii TaxID=351052 RepID=A0A3E0X0P8_9GAMM|nr:NAD-dependent epimerase/dehydratase family protein [Alkalilimnicola ehrlichii]RFA30255.1 hypothetical protein CAI21_06460 [Alkalilimnicola ehrlichii]RFA37835.1 hypothetical protein CAL65_07810 [Alkalilimnicola ehrlichii]
MTVAITGAGGFIGRVLAHRLHEGPTNPISISSQWKELPGGRPTPSLLDVDGWARSFKGAEVVVHLLGRAHILRERQGNPSEAFRQVNVDATQAVLEGARRAGVRRLVFVSSVGVHGPANGRVLRESDDLDASELYARSKLEAEKLVIEFAQAADFEWVIVRPPLVYGPGCPGNLHRLMELIYKGVPLPFGAVAGARSLIGVDNLSDFLVTCSKHPAAANQAFLVSDGEDIATGDLVRVLAQGMGRSPRLLNVPYELLLWAAKTFRKEELIRKVCDPLQVDSKKARILLGWHEVRSLSDGLLATARAFSESKKGGAAK